ncbi:MAG: alpha/beta hydrolase [Vulcanimicrobiaceae bacterium]
MGFAQARSAIERLQTLERGDARIASEGYTRLLDHGAQTERAIICFHGFTNCPEQFAELGRRFHAKGDTVYIPRLPHHGYSDRRTRALAALTHRDLQLAAVEAVILGASLGRRVHVVGLSLGGLLAAWTGQMLEVASTIAIAPLLSLAFPSWLNAAFPGLIRTLPDIYLWWDPLRRAASSRTPPYAYPGFPSRALGAQLGLRDELVRRMRDEKPRTTFAALILNDRDNVINNTVAHALFRCWQQAGASVVELQLSDLHAHHDIIDPWHRHLPLERIYGSIEALVPA